MFERDGRTWRRIGDHLNWPHQKMRHRLKDRSRYVRLHATWRDGDLKCPVRVLWRVGEGRLKTPIDQSSIDFAAWCACHK